MVLRGRLLCYHGMEMGRQRSRVDGGCWDLRGGEVGRGYRALHLGVCPWMVLWCSLPLWLVRPGGEFVRVLGLWIKRIPALRAGNLILLMHTGSRVDGSGFRKCICEKDDAIRTSGVMSPPGTIPIDNRALPVSYASDTVPFEHWVMATMTQRSDASFNASIRSER